MATSLPSLPTFPRENPPRTLPWGPTGNDARFLTKLRRPLAKTATRHNPTAMIRPDLTTLFPNSFRVAVYNLPQSERGQTELGARRIDDRGSLLGQGCAGLYLLAHSCSHPTRALSSSELRAEDSAKQLRSPRKLVRSAEHPRQGPGELEAAPPE